MKHVLEGEVGDRSFNQYVKFFGSIPYEKVSEMYRLADIYVIPSLFEGTPKSLLEAMFNSLPVIGTDTNGINGIICHKKNGLLFEKGNVKDLNEKIKEIVEDDCLSHRLGNSAKDFYLENYSFEGAISGFNNIYKKITEVDHD